jgi:hypothetical protein
MDRLTKPNFFGGKETTVCKVQPECSSMYVVMFRRSVACELPPKARFVVGMKINAWINIHGADH